MLGFAEILKKLSAHQRLLAELGRDFRDSRYDLVLLLDYPGFNLRLGALARRAGVKVLYYIPPKLWATRTRRRRVEALARAADRLAVILPFERDYFASHGLSAEYVGHPLLERPEPPSRSTARERLGIRAEDRILAIFPGSRPQEIDRLWPPFRDAALRLLDRGQVQKIVVAGLSGSQYPGAERFLVHPGEPATILAAADAALVKSGTATLEAALAGVPMVVAYRVHWLTALVARGLLAVPWISLVNLLAGRRVVPELLQRDVEPDRLAALVAPLLAGGAPALEQRDGLAEVVRQLEGGGHHASERVAAIAGELLG